MNGDWIWNVAINYAGLIILLTFHEVGHAWMAWKCGDSTAKDLGRVSLNPLVHIDPIGTVVLPILAMVLAHTGSAAAGFLIGWAKPVPVNPNNLQNPRGDDILISMAGPWMNLFLAILLVGLARLLITIGVPDAVPLCKMYASLSLMLCFFNMIPIPPLDGSHVLRVLVGMSRETYAQLARFGFIAVIIVMQLPLVRDTLFSVNQTTFRIIKGWFNLF
ncbi:MAG: site-2 protease family protein [Verrucomicrobia bacterium]|nr:site-2 protease family protein [Verrucomicrobiota bacterium]MBI3870546.1 site-2 protease family protein [Verrucomicrobiota bacterium]